MVTPQRPTQPGWHPYGVGHERYWDGTTWIGSVRPLTPPKKARASRLSQIRPIGWCGILAAAFVIYAWVNYAWINPPSKLERDASGRRACTTFVRLTDDVQAGIVADDEFRDRVSEVYDDGQFADSIEVRQASTRLLAEATTGTGDDAAGTIVAMTNACSDLADG
ncbi:MAG: hypothetical protein JWM89_1788 [Acidimicrobiales bacterium]|nr:hypothetical protein [Acidimicrobiales bacterium]